MKYYAVLLLVGLLAVVAAKPAAEPQFSHLQKVSICLYHTLALKGRPDLVRIGPIILVVSLIYEHSNPEGKAASSVIDSDVGTCGVHSMIFINSICMVCKYIMYIRVE